MKVDLITDRGSGARHELVLERRPAVIGRSPDADVCVNDPYVSRRHCEIEQLEGVLVVRDLGSRNGTYVDGHRATETLLMPGHALHTGATEFVVMYEREMAELEAARNGHDDLVKWRADGAPDTEARKSPRSEQLAGSDGI
jgi:predicted component of type VI protein secretion system